MRRVVTSRSAGPFLMVYGGISMVDSFISWTLVVNLQRSHMDLPLASVNQSLVTVVNDKYKQGTSVNAKWLWYYVDFPKCINNQHHQPSMAYPTTPSIISHPSPNTIRIHHQYPGGSFYIPWYKVFKVRILKNVQISQQCSDQCLDTPALPTSKGPFSIFALVCGFLQSFCGFLRVFALRARICILKTLACRATKRKEICSLEFAF